jgi:hypothetical protein
MKRTIRLKYYRAMRAALRLIPENRRPEWVENRIYEYSKSIVFILLLQAVAKDNRFGGDEE